MTYDFTLNYDFTPNLHGPLGINRSFMDGRVKMHVRCEYLPVAGCRPGEIYLGYQAESSTENSAEQLYLLVTVDELGDLIKTLKKIHKSWKAHEDAYGRE